MVVALFVSGTAQGRESTANASPAPCTADTPFELSPEPLARYAGAVWLSWPGGQGSGAVLSEDDGARVARGFRNRWHYYITGVASVGLPIGCSMRRLSASAIPGGMVSLRIDDLRLLMLPGDPKQQELVNQAAPACEMAYQLVDVTEVGGRWRITIEEPTWLPRTRERCY